MIQTIRSRSLITRLVQFFYYSLVALFLAITFYGIYELRGPLAVAVILYFLLNPVVDALEGFGMHRGFASFLALLFLGVLFTALIMFFGPIIFSEVQSLFEKGDTYREKALTIIQSIRDYIQIHFPGMMDAEKIDPSQIMSQILGLIGSMLPRGGEGIFTGISILQSYITDLLFDTIIALIALFFLLLQGAQIYIKLMELVPNRYFEMTLLLVSTVKNKINSYLLALAAQVAIMSTLFITGYSVIDLPYAPVVGLFAGLINMIPYLGPMIGAVPALLIALLDSGLSPLFFLTLGVIGFAQLIDQVFNQPVLLARAVNLNPILALISLGTFQSLFGVTGMIIAMPFTGIILVIIPVVRRNLKAFGVIS